MAIAAILMKIFDGGLISFISLCVLVGFYALYIKLCYAGTPPGPWGFPIFGYHFLLSKSPYQQFLMMTKHFGDVFSIKIGFRYVIVLNCYDSIKEAFVKEGDIYAGKLTDGLSSDFEDNKSVSMSEGDIWREQRNFLLSTMRDFGFDKARFEKQIQKEAKLTITEFLRARGQPLDIPKMMSLAVTNIISCFVFGQRFSYDDNYIIENLNILNQASTRHSQFSILETIPFLKFIIPKAVTGQNLYRIIKGKIYKFTDKQIKNHMKTFDENNIRDVVDAYLTKLRHIAMSGINRNDTVFTAGTNTTAYTLTWALKLLTLYPRIQRRIQEEIDTVIGRNRLPTINDKSKMPFTEATILEIHRFVSIVPITNYHRTTEETSLKGYKIPKHTLVLANLWSVHYDSRTWKEPFQFNPQRFLLKDGKVSNLREHVIPFSIGKRNCLGESLAKMEIFLFITCFLQKLVFLPTSGDRNLEIEQDMPFRKLKSCSLFAIPR